MKSNLFKVFYSIALFSLLFGLGFYDKQLTQVAKAGNTQGYMTQWDLSKTLVTHVYQNTGTQLKSVVRNGVTISHVNIGPSEWHVLSCIGTAGVVGIGNQNTLVTDANGYKYPQPICTSNPGGTTVKEIWQLKDYTVPHTASWDGKDFSLPESYISNAFPSAAYNIDIKDAQTKDEFNNFNSYLNVQTTDYNSDKDNGSCQSLGVVTNSGSYGVQFDTDDHNNCKVQTGEFWDAVVIPKQWTITGQQY